ncbi:hypothetical protein GCM10023084_06880 [Streptomyces lacrimifluminis]|uniref:Uncharacterized protein n=1 Tax=Streptomyces lacrimifluminis TaxID=1500077 RepID=A0A917KTK0_9ACTN|nr:hypothetical protein [Streptomyces lacrimifluminis]GGJ25846.1 hypothetical protein GCM10012282_22990 [Streptomyces lacrimifluminis]
MGAGILIVPLAVYVALVTVLCVKVGDRTSWKMGRLMAAAVVFLPIGVVIAALVP